MSVSLFWQFLNNSQFARIMIRAVTFTGRLAASSTSFKLITALTLFTMPKAFCVGTDDRKNDDDNIFTKFLKTGNNFDPNDPLKSIGKFMSSEIPGQVGYGFLMGYSSGFCLKKVSKFVAFTIGGIFIILQTLSYNGYIHVNYTGIQKEIEGAMDLNNDGKVDKDDANYAIDKIQDILSYQMPTGGGFAAGLFMGLRG